MSTDTVTTKVFVNEAHFKTISPKIQRRFCEFILDTGCTYFPHSCETSELSVHVLKEDGTISHGDQKNVSNDWWEMKLEDFDMTLLRVKFPNVCIFRKMGDYEHDTEVLEEMSMEEIEKRCRNNGNKPVVAKKTNWIFSNSRTLAEMLKTYIIHSELQELQENEEKEYISHKLAIVSPQ